MRPRALIRDPDRPVDPLVRHTNQARSFGHFLEMRRVRLLLDVVVEPRDQSFQLQPLQTPKRDVRVGDLGREAVLLRAGEQGPAQHFGGGEVAVVGEEFGVRHGAVVVCDEGELGGGKDGGGAGGPGQAQRSHVGEVVAEEVEASLNRGFEGADHLVGDEPVAAGAEPLHAALEEGVGVEVMAGAC